MDPNRALADIRRLVARLDAGFNGPEPFDPADAHELAELVDGLDQWLSRGGFLPDAWAKRKW